MTVPRAELAPGVSIPRILNGCWQLASTHRQDGCAHLDAEAALDLLSDLAGLGLSAFDGADIYTGVEELLGAFRRRYLAAGGDAAALRLHTKFVPDLDALPTLDAAYVRRIVDRSRARLGVERLDLVQFHWWDFGVPGWVEAARALNELVERGWIAHLGVTNFDAARLAPILAAGVPIVSNQVQVSLLDRRAERGTGAFCREGGISLLAYGALAGGFLSEHWLGRPDPGTAVPNRSLIKYRLIIEEAGGWVAFQELLALLARIGEKHGAGIAAVALRWTLDRPGVAAVLLGASSLARAREDLNCFTFELDGDDHAQIDAHLARHPGPAGDIYALERLPGGRHAAILRTGLNRG